MSLEDKNIDQMFSDAAHSQKAPQYDPAYWAEMNAMLNARDAKKRGFLFWAFGGTIVFAGLFLSYSFSIWTYQKHKKDIPRLLYQQKCNLKMLIIQKMQFVQFKRM